MKWILRKTLFVACAQTGAEATRAPSIQIAHQHTALGKRKCSWRYSARFRAIARSTDFVGTAAHFDSQKCVFDFRKKPNRVESTALHVAHQFDTEGTYLEAEDASVWDARGYRKFGRCAQWRNAMRARTAVRYFAIRAGYFDGVRMRCVNSEVTPARRVQLKRRSAATGSWACDRGNSLCAA